MPAIKTAACATSSRCVRSGFGCACCPPNIARIVESVQEYAYTVAEDGGTLFTHLYMGGVAKAELNGTAVELDVTANLPWQGDGKAVVRLGGDAAGTSAQAPARFTLAFRLPVGWAMSPLLPPRLRPRASLSLGPIVPA